jgi:putative YphP/YqiW family bacilliredoxin
MFLPGSIVAGDLNLPSLASARQPHPPGIAADLAVLHEAARHIRLDVDFRNLAAVRARHEKFVVHGLVKTVVVHRSACTRDVQYRMPYPEFFVEPMRLELTRLGVEELRTAAEVESAVRTTPGTLMIVVNSVCGCAAGKARPGIALALQHGTRPERVTTVFAGADVEATERARSYFKGYPPSSPSVALLRDSKVLFMLERWQIENQNADQIAATLTAAFDKTCSSGSKGSNGSTGSSR